MAGPLDEFERSVAFGEIALGQIRSSRQLALPRNYEIWYVYATETNPALSKAINETLARNGKLTDANLAQIYDTYLSHTRSSNQIEQPGMRVIHEIDDVMSVVDGALGIASAFSGNLVDAEKKLSLAASRDHVKAVIEMLVRSTHKMEEANRALERRLKTSRQAVYSLQQNLETIRAESLTDPLTGLGNRKYFDRAVTDTATASVSDGRPLSLLMLDIDRFKSFNDNYGHLIGDQVLRLVALSLKQTIKGQDIVARYGGEEFAVVLPNTALRQALAVAENIRRAVMSRELKKKSSGEILGRVTISVGIATLQSGDDVYTLIERADQCLYAAKRNGRNRVVCETDDAFASSPQPASQLHSHST